MKFCFIYWWLYIVHLFLHPKYMSQVLSKLHVHLLCRPWWCESIFAYSEDLHVASCSCHGEKYNCHHWLMTNSLRYWWGSNLKHKTGVQGPRRLLVFQIVKHWTHDLIRWRLLLLLYIHWPRSSETLNTSQVMRILAKSTGMAQLKASFAFLYTSALSCHNYRSPIFINRGQCWFKVSCWGN